MANPHGNTEGEGGVGGSGGYKQRQLLAKLQGGAAVGYHLLKVGEITEISQSSCWDFEIFWGIKFRRHVLHN